MSYLSRYCKDHKTSTDKVTIEPKYHRKNIKRHVDSHVDKENKYTGECMRSVPSSHAMFTWKVLGMFIQICKVDV